ncbi:prolipoprotein diacylglyceryl transferase [Rhodococcus ruber]|nr:prolipoprotein diacylglyceryl transferase [Rhodococcus ruber]
MSPPARVEAAPTEQVSGSAVPRGCAEAFSGIEPQAVAVTYEGDLSEARAEEHAVIAFGGTRQDSDGGGRTQRAEKIVTVHALPPGIDRFTVTGRLVGLAGGRWDVAAVRLDPRTDRPHGAVQRSAISTRPAALAYGPAVRVWSWPVLVGVGAVLALLLQAIMLRRAGMNYPAVTAVSVVACVLGFVGAKVWYLVLHRRHPRFFLKAGACIQGFLLTAFAVLAVGALVLRMPVGVVLDATTPGLFLGMALGRPGCFLTGCCAGRPTRSRWGMWSSDRTVAVRRVPVQLIEAGAALAIGSAATWIVWTRTASLDGTVFMGSIAAYVLVRQLLFPYRSDPHTRRGRLVTVVLAATLLVITVGSVWFR